MLRPENRFHFNAMLAQCAEKVAREIVLKSVAAEREGNLRDAALQARDASDAFREAARIGRVAAVHAPTTAEANLRKRVAAMCEDLANGEVAIVEELLIWATRDATHLPVGRTADIRGRFNKA